MLLTMLVLKLIFDISIYRMNLIFDNVVNELDILPT